MSVAVETFTRKAPIYMGRLMRDFDFTDVDAAAIMGNAGHESGGLTEFQEKKPTKPGSRGGFGWFQWTGVRRKAYEKYCRDNGLDPRSDEANYGFLVTELKGSESRAVPKTKAARRLEDKVKAFELAFERAGIKHYPSRIKWAERALVAWNASEPDVAFGKPTITFEQPGMGAPSGAGMLRLAREHIGEEYRNIQIPKDNARWKGPWDCAEFMSWLVYQEAGILYGCVDNQANPKTADAYTGSWKIDVERFGKRVSVEEAAATVGGIVLRYPPGAGKMGHIAMCDGKGGTVEAKGRRYGVVADKVHGRKWDSGVLIPGISYESGLTMAVVPPEVVYAPGAPNMVKAIIIRIQEALKVRGFDPGEIDGDFGPITQAAVAAFQEAEGLVVDGEVGPETAKALGISLTEELVLPDTIPDKVFTGSPLHLLVLVLTLLSKEKPMAEDSRLGIDPGKVLLPLLLQSLLTGKRIDTGEILATVLTGKPILTSMPTPMAMPMRSQKPQLASEQLPADLSAILLPLLYERLAGKPLPEETPAASVTQPAKQEKPLTPINAALGQTVGSMLNGRKTGIGIAGLLATTLLPVFFPQLAPIAAVVQAAGGSVTDVIAGGGGEALIKQAPMAVQSWGGSITEVAQPLFAALTGWGVLGKLDKWFSRMPQ